MTLLPKHPNQATLAESGEFYSKMIAGLFKKFLATSHDSKPVGTGPVLATHFTRTPQKPAPLSGKEQDELDHLLGNALADDVLGCVTALDGFLTLLAVGPHIAPEEWLGFLFPEALPLDDEQTRRMLTLIERRHHHIVFDLARTKPHFEPLFVGFTQAKTAKPLGRRVFHNGLWCAGFMAGTDLRPHKWGKLLDTNNESSPLYTPWMLGTPEGEEKRWNETIQYYRDSGYDANEARLMTLRWYGLPGPRRALNSELKKLVLNLLAHRGK
jgi:yecA family protein